MPDRGYGYKSHPLARRPRCWGSFQAAVAKARRQQSLPFASLLSEESILEAFGPARRLAGLDLYSRGDRRGVSVRMLEPGSLLSRRCGAVDRPARGPRAACLFGGDERLLHGPGQPPRSGLPPTGLPEGERLGVRGTRRVAVAQAARAHGRRLHNHDAGNGGRPGRVSANGVLELACRFPIARIAFVFSLSVGTVLEGALGRYEGKQTGVN
jgi:hypothetical protein